MNLFLDKPANLKHSYDNAEEKLKVVAVVLKNTPKISFFQTAISFHTGLMSYIYTFK
jgi:hypothetical protein